MDLIDAETLTGKRLLLYGAGVGGTRGYRALRDSNSIVCFADSNPSKWGTSHCGLRVVRPEAIARQEFDFVVIASMYREEIGAKLKQLGVPDAKVASLSARVLEGRAQGEDRTGGQRHRRPPALALLASSADRAGNVRLAIDAYSHIARQARAESVPALEMLWALLMEAGETREAAAAADRLVQMGEASAPWFAQLVSDSSTTQERRATAIVGSVSSQLRPVAPPDHALALQVESVNQLIPGEIARYVVVHSSGLRPIRSATVLDLWARTADQGSQVILSDSGRWKSVEWPDRHYVPGHLVASPIAPVVTLLILKGFNRIDLAGDVAGRTFEGAVRLANRTGRRRLDDWTKERIATARLLRDCATLGVRVSVGSELTSSTAS